MKASTFKFITIGESSVGKTCIITRCADDIFREKFLTTVGVDFKLSDRIIDGRQVKLQIWDTAGQEQFHTITKSYFRGAQGVILVFDLTSRRSFDRTHIWMDSITETAPENIDIVLVGNKTDLPDRLITVEEGRDLATVYGAPYFETSAKTGENISLVFDSLARAVMARIAADPPPKASHVGFDELLGDIDRCC
jgi:Ras-related protein Rab-8A